MENLYFPFKYKADNHVTFTLNYSSLQSWGTKQMCSDNSRQPLKNRMFQGKETCTGNALSKALFAAGHFIQHKMSGLKSSPQVTGCDNKVLAKWDTDVLKDGMHEATTRIPKSPHPGGQKEKPSSREYWGLFKLRPQSPKTCRRDLPGREDRHIKDIPGWGHWTWHSADTMTPER